MVSIEGLPHVWVSSNSPGGGCCTFIQSASRFNKPKPDELTSVDALLWQNFSFEIDQHVSKIDAWLKTMSTIGSIIAAPLFILFLAAQFDNPLKEYVIEYNEYFGVVLVIIGVIYFGLHYWIISKNQKADEEIKNVCQTFASKFKLTGFAIEYRTQNTGLCSGSRNARATRAIVFPPVPSFQESQTVDDGNGVTNDGGIIDHKPPATYSQNSQTNNDSNGFVDNNLLDPKLWGKN
mmetsp:Transcript_31075/g.36936  ORF Transcript_31075/g.36936 Transcript_31075/m.36936 type:complete len:235 (-) Transcript_31075:359-1063(-)